MVEQRRLEQELQALHARNEQLMEESREMQNEVSTICSTLNALPTPPPHRISSVERSVSAPLWDIMENALQTSAFHQTSVTPLPWPIFAVPPPVLHRAIVPQIE